MNLDASRLKLTHPRQKGNTVMPSTIACPNCDAKFKADEKLYGKQVKCTKCGNPFMIPSPAPAVARVTEPDPLEQLAQAASQPSTAQVAPPAAPAFQASAAQPNMPPVGRICLACGYRGIGWRKKIPVWAIVVAILCFPLGLFALMAKTTQCPHCGEKQ